MKKNGIIYGTGEVKERRRKTTGCEGKGGGEREWEVKEREG